MKRGDGDCDPAAPDFAECCGGSRRSFLKRMAAIGAFAPAGAAAGLAAGTEAWQAAETAAPPSDGQPVVEEASRAATTGAPIALPRTLEGEALSEVAFPLGGIGTGTISLGGRGELRDWEIFNRPEKGIRPAFCFATLWARPAGGEAVARVLETKPHPPYGGQAGLGWPNAPGMPRLDSCVFRGEYPFARIDFTDRELPVEVSLEAWNPLVPLDAESSGLPVAVLRYRLRNAGARAVDVSIAWSVDNPVTELGSTPQGPIGAATDEGRVNERRDGDGLTGLLMTNPKLAADHPRMGSFAVAALDSDLAVTLLPKWRRYRFEAPLRLFWDDFVDDGALDPARHHPSPGDELKPEPPRLEVGSVCASRRIEAGAEATIVFLLAWHFPNRTARVCGWGAPKGDEDTVIGNWYTTRFTDAWDAVTRVAPRLPELERESRAFLDAMKSTDLPAEVIEAAVANLSVLRTNTCFRTADGRFHGFEGCRDDKGCCPGTCTHVWNYDGALSFLYPELSRAVRELELGYATDDEGRMDFRYLLPYGKSRFGAVAADGQMGVLVRLYVDWRLGGDRDWLRGLWPAAKRALEFAWIENGWDADRDGVMEGCQHNTYDVEFFGPNPLCGVLYLAALRAGEEMAGAVGDGESARRYRELFERGSAWIDANLFDGEYYVQRIEGRAKERIAAGLMSSNASGDPRDPQNQMGDGCLADQLFGQTMAHLAGLGPLLDPAHMHSALDSIVRYNFKRSLEDHVGLLRTYALNDEAGVVICDYGAKPAPASPFFYDTEVWPGIEYQLAALLFHEGRSEAGLEIVRAVRARFDGLRRNPWDEAECGHHYVRSLASWTAVWLLTGFNYHAAEQREAISPRLAGDPVRGFWCVPSGWGTYLWSRPAAGPDRVEVAVERGRLDCRILELTGGAAGPRVKAREAVVELGSRRVPTRLRASATSASIELAQPTTVDAGETLSVLLR